jgi:hypothetical protein
MKLKNFIFVGDNEKSYSKLLNLNLPIKYSYELRKFYKVFLEKKGIFIEEKVNLFKKYGEPLKDDPNNYRIKNENLDIANKELNELFQIEEDYPDIKIPLAILIKYGIELSAMELSILDDILEEKEEE